jgi:P4 family phage/plasmid primase-like protien
VSTAEKIDITPEKAPVVTEAIQYLAGQEIPEVFDQFRGATPLIRHLREHGWTEDQILAFISDNNHPATRQIRAKYSDSLNGVVRIIWDRADWENRQYTPHSDDGTGRRLGDMHGADLAWDFTISNGGNKESGNWRAWDGTRWAEDKGIFTKVFAKELAQKCRDIRQKWYDKWMFLENNPVSDGATEQAKKAYEQAKNEARRKTKEWGEYSQSVGSNGSMNSALAMLRSEPGMAPNKDLWDADPNLLATPRGTIELDGDWGTHVREARREDRLTRSTAVGLTQADWKAGLVACRFEKMLEEALPNREVRRYFQKLMGYILFGKNSKRKFIVLHGETSSGKTTILQIIAGVLGDYAADFNLSLFRASKDEKPRPDIVRAMGARMIFSSEASNEWELHADQIKRLTGGDTVHARNLFANEFTSRQPAFTPVLATNAVPTIIGADEAIWRRLIVFWFGNTIEAHREDPELVARIVRDEGPAVLNWLLDGWYMYQGGEELEDGTYIEPGLDDMPAEVVNATMKFRSKLTSEDQWINECTGRIEGAHETAAALYATYTMWCKDNGIKNIGTSTSLGKALTRAGFPADKANGARCRINIKILSGYQHGVDLEEHERTTRHIENAVQYGVDLLDGKGGMTPEDVARYKADAALLDDLERVDEYEDNPDNLR